MLQCYCATAAEDIPLRRSFPIPFLSKPSFVTTTELSLRRNTPLPRPLLDFASQWAFFVSIVAGFKRQTVDDKPQQMVKDLTGAPGKTAVLKGPVK